MGGSPWLRARRCVTLSGIVARALAVLGAIGLFGAPIFDLRRARHHRWHRPVQPQALGGVRGSRSRRAASIHPGVIAAALREEEPASLDAEVTTEEHQSHEVAMTESVRLEPTRLPTVAT